MYVRAANRFRLVPPGWISPEYTRTRGCIDGAPERVGSVLTQMRSTTLPGSWSC